MSTLLFTLMHNSAACSARVEQNGYAVKPATVSCVPYSGIAVRRDSKCDMIQLETARYATRHHIGTTTVLALCNANVDIRF